MGLTSLAAGNESTSPFYLRNKEIAERWEKFVLNKGGKIIGRYSAWALELKCGFMLDGVKYIFDISKATYTQALFAPAKWSLAEFTTLTVAHLKVNAPTTMIRRKTLGNQLSALFGGKWETCGQHSKYQVTNGQKTMLPKLLLSTKHARASFGQTNLRKLELNRIPETLTVRFGKIIEDMLFIDELLKAVAGLHSHSQQPPQHRV